MVVGLTGGTGAGKSTVAALFAQNGWRVVDFDQISRAVCKAGSPCLAELSGAFGEQILLPDGNLNRKKLGQMVFGDAGRLRILNEITHKYIIEAAQAQMAGGGNILLDAPLLFEAGLDGWCDKVVCVTADDAVRAARIMARDGLPREGALARIKSQAAQEELVKKSDFIMENNGGPLEERVAALMRELEA